MWNEHPQKKCFAGRSIPVLQALHFVAFAISVCRRVNTFTAMNHQNLGDPKICQAGPAAVADRPKVLCRAKDEANLRTFVQAIADEDSSRSLR
jgi:hypothetical protein